MNKLILIKKKEPLSDSDRKLISPGTMIKLCYEGKEPFYAIISTGALAKVDNSNNNFYFAGVKLGEEIRFKTENILGII